MGGGMCGGCYVRGLGAVFFVVVALLSLGCRGEGVRGCPASLGAVAHEDFVGVHAAALWWWLDRVEDPRELGWLFVGVDGEDLDDDLRAELRRRYWTRPRYWRVKSLLLPASIAADDENGFAHDVTTGERGTRLWVAGTRFSSATSAKANVGITGVGDLGGGSTEVSLRCDESGWRVAEIVSSLAY